MPSPRVAYLFTWNDFESSGVPQKVVEQIGAWAKLGSQVCIHLVSQSPHALSWVSNVNIRLPGVVARLHEYRNPLERIPVMRKVFDSAISEGYEIAYSRQDFFIPGVSVGRAQIPVVLEVNSDDVAEEKYMSLTKRIYSRATRRLELEAAAGFVFVSRELEEGPSFSNFSQPRVIIGNGVDLFNAPIPKAAESGGTRFVFIGTGDQQWHGIDKVLRLAEARPHWRFDLIGPRKANFNALPANVRLHGPLDATESNRLMQGAHIALGTLALHRKAMVEASPLKVRHYLSLGLPTISAHLDTDFTEGAPFLLMLPNEEDNVVPNLDLIDAFVEEWRGARVPRSALQHLDVLNKERQRLEFFKSLAK